MIFGATTFKKCPNPNCNNPAITNGLLPTTSFDKNKKRKDGLCCWCKDCVTKYHRRWYLNNREKLLKLQKIWRDTHKEEKKRRSKQYSETHMEEKRKRGRIYNLIKIHGLTDEEYNKMFDEQHGLCAICNKLETRVDKITSKICKLAVDHNHETGKIRGLLCGKCNRSLGVIEPNIDTTIEYLEKYKG